MITSVFLSLRTDTIDVGNRSGFRVRSFFWRSPWCAYGNISPVIGGVLSHPADQWPHTLGKVALLRDYPYFLPCAAAAMVPLSSFVFSILFLEEVSLCSARKIITDGSLAVDVEVCCDTKDAEERRRKYN